MTPVLATLLLGIYLVARTREASVQMTVGAVLVVLALVGFGLDRFTSVL